MTNYTVQRAGIDLRATAFKAGELPVARDLRRNLSSALCSRELAMRPGVPAHVRRSCALLEWISRERMGATIRWRTAELGTWQDLQAGWRITGTRIRFCFLANNRRIDSLVSSVRLANHGARIHFSTARSDALDVVWESSRSRESPEAGCLCDSAREWARHQFPGCRIVSATQRADRTHSLSGSYLRVFLRHRGETLLLLACPADLPFDRIPRLLTQALLWCSFLQARRRLKGVPKAHLLVPAGHSAAIQHRVRLLNRARVKVEVWDYTSETGGPWQVRHALRPGPPVEERDFRWPVLGPFRWSRLLARVLELAPHQIRRYPRFRDYDSLRLWGLEFARVHGLERDQLEFGIGPMRTPLTEECFGDLRRLVDDILFYRRADGPDPCHPFYRMQAERWLESLILEESDRLFPELLPEAIYPQIPVYLGKDPGRVDVLAADREGTLVVLELKVTADPDLPLQALDYWGRVIRHNRGGDFERRGYFIEARLNRSRPRIYLVSPVFGFHDSTERLLRFLDPEIELWKIFINQDWRAGVKVLRRIRVRCGELD